MKKAIKWTATGAGFALAFLAIMFLHLFIITEGDYIVAKTVDQDPSLPHIHLGERLLHGETFGNDSNQTVIVIHGGPGGDYRYLLPLTEMEDEFYLVFYDQLGSGLSPRVAAEQLTLEQMLDDLHQLVNSYSHGKKVNLIGHSWGALLAANYVSAYPNRVEKVILAEPWLDCPDLKIGRIEIWKSLVESMHVKGPDKSAASDYYLSAIRKNCKNMNCDTARFWRFGALARKTLLKGGLEWDGNVNLEKFPSNKITYDKCLYIAGELHSVPMNDYLIDPFSPDYPIHHEMIRGADRLLSEHSDQLINTLRHLLNEKEQ